MLSVIAGSDEVLLIENGVYLKTEQLPAVKTYALLADLSARGVSIQQGHVGIDYEGFVELCTQHTKVVSW